MANNPWNSFKGSLYSLAKSINFVCVTLLGVHPMKFTLWNPHYEVHTLMSTLSSVQTLDTVTLANSANPMWPLDGSVRPENSHWNSYAIKRPALFRKSVPNQYHWIGRWTANCWSRLLIQRRQSFAAIQILDFKALQFCLIASLLKRSLRTPAIRR